MRFGYSLVCYDHKKKLLNYEFFELLWDFLKKAPIKSINNGLKIKVSQLINETMETETINAPK